MFDLHENDLEDFNEAVGRVWSLMQDGEWHAASEIEEAAGLPGRPAREGFRRMRELRPLLDVRGWSIECRRIRALHRDSMYRVIGGDV